MLLYMNNVRFLLQQLKDRSGVTKSRRSLFIVILSGTLIFYLLSKFVPHRLPHETIEYDPCLQSRLEEYSIERMKMDAIINHHPIHFDEINSLPFTGNGYIGLAFSMDADLHLIPENRSSSFIPTGFSPLIQISMTDAKESSATILHLRQGFVEQIQCFHLDDRRISLSNRIYAHRSRSSLFIQEFDLINPSEQTIEFDLQRKFSRRSKSTNEKKLKIDGTKENFVMKFFQIDDLRMVIIQNEISSKQMLKANDRFQKMFLSIVKYSSQMNFTELEQQGKDELVDIIRSSSSSDSLFVEHRSIWASIWQSSFSISRSFAPSAINGDVINRTMYYVVCSSPALLYQKKLDENQRQLFNETLFRFDRCYDSHSTLIGERLWRCPGDVLAVSQLTKLWRTTLEKHGCSTLMRSGANGILQAMLLSIGAVRYRNHHLEMHLDPKELHRDLDFYSIHFGQYLHLNISIKVEADNRAGIYISIDQDQSRAYACDAGCIDSPTKLKREPIRFPVKMTNPATAILYVTEDFDYMTQLKDTLHVKEVEIAPPHAHNLLALHRHGHQLGGLPVIFWLILAFLIVIFHLFLLKIILNEMGFVKSSLPVYNSRTRIH